MSTLRLLAVAVLAIAASVVGAQSTSAVRPNATHTQFTGVPLDINTATPRQLKALPGFGDAYVRRVIAGRPYTAKNQLVTRGILPQSAYDRISPCIVAHRPHK
ncbi:MAG TPA: helix-hairpin-helix domain-containing protein [Acidobacteriaceae bacterium]